jgi:hypothetical protein
MLLLELSFLLPPHHPTYVFKKQKSQPGVMSHTTVIPALRRQKQEENPSHKKTGRMAQGVGPEFKPQYTTPPKKEDCTFLASLGYIVRSCSKNKVK